MYFILPLSKSLQLIHWARHVGYCLYSQAFLHIMQFYQCDIQNLFQVFKHGYVIRGDEPANKD